ncbi:MAG TPA: S4 domain-containing protein [Geminicoccus sp.]|uniref:RNA-binding S4 domain-containing protein n=1 Tax=Geminicoccus sp. TaxID=2024832 RepID=UPI002E344B22|nr:S4 domain-containing protein [Geminicoccus sp.]HEX2529313.1 S4 domain-containing protein [Geminicoccus sp.]
MQDEALRLDTWLWHTRFCKSRSDAQKLVEGGWVRVDERVVTKSHLQVRTGMVLTLPQGRDIKVVRVLAMPRRRGPFSEAREHYQELPLA